MVRLDQDNREAYTSAILSALEHENIKTFRNDFLDLHPQDQREIYLSLADELRKRLYTYLSPEEYAEIFEGLEPEEQKQFVTEIDSRYAIEVFNNMSSDDVADFFGEISDSNAAAYLKKMSTADAREVRELLAYPDETAGAIMTTEFISISHHMSVAEVMELLRQEGPDAETIYYLYVVDDEQKLVGVVSLRDLIIAKPNLQIEDIMSSRVVSVEVLDDQEDVANTIKKYDLLAVPVVDERGHFIGIVTVDDVIDVLEDEATEDIGEISAVRGAVELDVSFIGAAQKRAPWLIVLMFLGLITAGVIGQFEETLEAYAILAVFIPLIMDSAGNTGTQSLAVVVRSLALGALERNSVWRLLRRELLTGLMLGLICGVVLSVLIPFVYDRHMVLGFVVGISLFFTLSIATVVGALIPLIINKLKIDPAVASGPFITTINDIVGLMIYFSIATALLHYLI